MPLPKPLKDLLTLPTASFVEGHILDYLREVCGALPGVTLKSDKWGNLLARYRLNPPKTAPLTFTAHCDHPGFVATSMRDKRTVLADFRGWVEPEYFANERVRFWSDGEWVRGQIREITREAKLYRMIGRTARPEEVAVRVAKPVEPNAPGMWDLPDPRLKGDLVLARGCDDLAGVASMVALLQRLSKKQAKADVFCLFTRAEEVGFIGAIGAARDRTIPLKSPVIAIETSKALPNARIGDGPILRVGDKSSIFDPRVTAFMDRVGKDLLAKRKTFKYQRKLMDGGTCESTAYCAYGYMATGVCVALGNYHNMDTKRKRISSEYISLSDWKGMVDWFEALVMDKTGFSREAADMRKGLDERFAKYRRLL
ncbi:MAG: hypothetical protein KDA32_01830 [Phycisphaerales bacterium]|nr:hypothetical protein [Phycisphaerales bacterium]